MSRVATPSNLPMFYRTLERLDPERHLGMGLRGRGQFAHIRNANAIPLGTSEFAVAAAHFPIVFAPAAKGAIPIAVTGVMEGQNLFVDQSGHWDSAAYLPGYLRRYPFWMTVEDDGQSGSLWFDSQTPDIAPLKDDSQARPLFNFQGEANDALLEIMQFCRLCLQDEYATAQFVAALEKENLLVQRQASMSFATGGTYELTGFRAVDEQAYLQLPDATLASWVRNGWAALIAVHLWSMANNWTRLLARHEAAGSVAAAQGVGGTQAVNESTATGV